MWRQLPDGLPMTTILDNQQRAVKFLGEPDAVTVDALREVVMEGLDPLNNAVPPFVREQRANAIVQTLIGLFYVRLREEPDGERTDPVRPAP